MSEIKKLLKEKRKYISQGLYKEAASICDVIGSELFDQEKYDEALEQYLEELEFCEMTGEELDIAIANRRIGECYASLYDFKKALIHVRKFYDISVRLKSVLEEQRAWATFGRTYYLKYQHEHESGKSETLSKTLDQAELAYYKALKLLYTLGSEIKPIELAEMKCRLLLNLGLVCETRGNQKGSAKYIEQGLEIATENCLYEDIYRCSFALGTMYEKNEKHEEAREVFDTALTAAKKLPNKNLISEVQLSKGLSLISLEKYEEAKLCLKSAYKLHKKNNEDYDKISKTFKICIGLCNAEKKLKGNEDLKEIKMFLEKIADGLSSISCYKLAIKKYLLTLDCMEKLHSSLCEKAPIYYSLAQTYLDDGNIPNALKYFEEEYNCNEGKPLEQITTLWKIADIHESEGNVDKTEELYLKSVSLAENVGDQSYIHNSLSKLLSFYKSINKISHVQNISEKLDKIKFECSSEDECEESQDPFDDIHLSELSDSDNEEVITSRRRTKKVETKVNEKGETPLHQACINGNLNAVKRFVENGHSVNVRDYCGWTPLHEACNYGFYDIVEYLLDKGADINDPGGPKCGGITALHDAASCGNFDVIRLLIDKGASVTVKDENGETPLDALLQWKRRTIAGLDSVTLKQCTAVVDELRSKMNETGLSIDDCTFYGEASSHSCSVKSLNVRSGEKRSRSPSLSSNDSYDDESDCSSSYLNVNNGLDRDDARAEYKSVMESLRRSAAQISPVKSKPPKVIEGPSLLNENEIINEWLIKDTTNVIPKRKKRKRAKLNVRTSKCIDNYLISKENESNISLVDEDSNISITSVNSEKNSGQISPSCSSSKGESSKLIFSLRVHIGNKLILVPVPDDTCTISWLSEEAARRFQSLDGSKPHLTLTKNDALLSGSDVVKTIFSNNEEVFSSVEKWDEPSLEEKYIQLCNKHNIAVSSSIKKQLQFSKALSDLNFSNCSIPYSHISIIFCTLLNYKSLHHLNISGVSLNESNVRELIASIPSFSNLVSLNLSCCCLTSQSVEKLVDYIDNQACTSNVLPSLKFLDLSFNNFSSSSCFTALFTLNSLISLNLSSCSLNSSFFSDVTLEDAMKRKANFEELDISGNILADRDMSNYLYHLPKRNLTRLNLRHTLEKGINLGFKLQIYFNEMLPCLSELLLQGCYLTDADIDQIAECLSYCPHLQICDLSANPLVSSHSLHSFINRAYENNLSITDLNITGTCSWYNQFNTITDFIKLKSLRHLCLDNCPEDITEKLTQLWISKWGNRAVCINYGFCELSVT